VLPNPRIDEGVERLGPIAADAVPGPLDHRDGDPRVADRLEAGVPLDWRESLAESLARTSNFMVEQTALNHAVYTRDLPAAYLPFYCNYLCHVAEPKVHRASARLLEIGRGWGGFALHAAARYGCRITTVTISREQYELASRRVRDAGLADRVEVLLADYRELDPADHMAHTSLSMFWQRKGDIDEAERQAAHARMKAWKAELKRNPGAPPPDEGGLGVLQ